MSAYLNLLSFDLASVLLPPGEHMIKEEVSCCLTGVWHISRHFQTLLQPPHFLQEFHSLSKYIIHSAVPETLNKPHMIWEILTKETAEEGSSSIYLLKSFSLSKASSPWPRRKRCLSSTSRAMIFSKSWFRACQIAEMPDECFLQYEEKLRSVQGLYLIGMCDNESPLIREVVIQVGDNLDSHISLASARRSNHLKEEIQRSKVKWMSPDAWESKWWTYQSKTRLHASTDGFHLGWCERDLVPERRETLNHMRAAQELLFWL